MAPACQPRQPPTAAANTAAVALPACQPRQPPTAAANTAAAALTQRESPLPPLQPIQYLVGMAMVARGEFAFLVAYSAQAMKREVSTCQIRASTCHFRVAYSAEAMTREVPVPTLWPTQTSAPQPALVRASSALSLPLLT
jgi:Kef-type K+ transport system membrane component KefB